MRSGIERRIRRLEQRKPTEELRLFESTMTDAEACRLLRDICTRGSALPVQRHLLE